MLTTYRVITLMSVAAIILIIRLKPVQLLKMPLCIVTGDNRERIFRSANPLAVEQQGHPGGR